MFKVNNKTVKTNCHKINPSILRILIEIQLTRTSFSCIYLFKDNNRNTRKRCEICSKLTIKTPERRQRRSDVFIVNFEHISELFPVLLFLTLNK